MQSPTSIARALLLPALLLSLAGPAPAFGQAAPADETLVGSVQSSGGYGALTIQATALKGDFAIASGVRGGWIINRRYVLGGVAEGITTQLGSSAPVSVDGEPAHVRADYGGLLLEYVGAPAELLHYGVELVVGGGSAQLKRSQYPGGIGMQFDGSSLDSSPFFLTEAGARAELNVTTFFRIGLGGGYRFVAGPSLQTVSNGDLSAPYGQLSFRFGSF